MPAKISYIEMIMTSEVNQYELAAEFHFSNEVGVFMARGEIYG